MSAPAQFAQAPQSLYNKGRGDFAVFSERGEHILRSDTFAAAAIVLALTGLIGMAHAAPVHTTYLWHMHQPIYWPDRAPGPVAL